MYTYICIYTYTLYICIYIYMYVFIYMYVYVVNTDLVDMNTRRCTRDSDPSAIYTADRAPALVSQFMCHNSQFMCCYLLRDCVIVCCSVLQRVAACCNVLRDSNSSWYHPQTCLRAFHFWQKTLHESVQRHLNYQFHDLNYQFHKIAMYA